MEKKDIKMILETLVNENYENQMKLSSEAYELCLDDEQRTFDFGFEQGFIQALVWVGDLIGAELVSTKEELGVGGRNPLKETRGRELHSEGDKRGRNK